MSLISIFKTPIIEFLTTEQHYDILTHPGPASKFIPEWYRELPTTIKSRRDIKGSPAMTSKKCLPMMDILTFGFIIPLAADIHVRTNEDASMIDITENTYCKLTEEHSQDQVGSKFPYPNKHLVKFINPFVIKTAPGYSCMFMPPVNHVETRFVALGGIVETDKYDREINFPSVWMANNYDDVIPAGTPIVQCIPFKRDAIIKKHKVRPYTSEEFKNREITRMKQDAYNSYYSNNLRVKK
jgi:hypothetical protein